LSQEIPLNQASDDGACVIVGASHAGVSLALQLRREGWTGPIQLLSAQADIPYHRPPLSKEFLTGNKQFEQILLRPGKMFADQNIELKLGARVTEVDAVNKLVRLEGGESLDYAALALCSGAQVRKLEQFNDYENVYYLRDIADARRLQQAMQPKCNAVIVGGGYIGLEVAAAMRLAGMNVTVLEREDRILNRVTGEAMSGYMSALHSSHGVELVCNTEISEVHGAANVEGITCSNGEHYPADVVIVGVGVVPETTLAESCGITVDNGICVDEYTATNISDIYAAGDCSNFPSALYGMRLRLESVQNANDQARAAAANICGKQQIYNPVPWFWSDQFGIKLQMAGLSSGYETCICRGNPEDMDVISFALFYLSGGRVIAADCVGRPKEFMASKQLIQSGVEVNPERLADETVDPAQFQKT